MNSDIHCEGLSFGFGVEWDKCKSTLVDHFICLAVNLIHGSASISFMFERLIRYTTIHGLLIEYGPICHIVKLRISMIRPFPLVNISHITLYPQLEIIWKVSKSLRKYWGKYGQISFYIISIGLLD